MDVDEPSTLSFIRSLGKSDPEIEDHNRTEHTRATGFMGKPPEISWIQRLQTDHEKRRHLGVLELNKDEGEEIRDVFSIHAMNHPRDELEISAPLSS
jgi:hypothetical protein